MNKFFSCLCNEYVLAAVALVGILVFASTADADWTVQEVDNNTVAMLHGSVMPNDVIVPDADLYIINSTGGNVAAGFTIANKIKASNAKVGYVQALSVAATIAVETNAVPADENSILGFHWCYTPGGDNKYNDDKYSQGIMRRVYVGCVQRYGMEKTIQLFNHMTAIKTADQSKSMVIMTTDGNFMLFVNGERQLLVK